MIYPFITLNNNDEPEPPPPTDEIEPIDPNWRKKSEDEPLETR